MEHVPDPRLEWFDTAWKDKQRENAKTIAKAYIEENRSNLQRFENMTLEDLVQNIDAARRLGNEEERILTDMWLLSEYEPQNIEGSIRMGRED